MNDFFSEEARKDTRDKLLSNGAMASIDFDHSILFFVDLPPAHVKDFVREKAMRSIK